MQTSRRFLFLTGTATVVALCLLRVAVNRLEFVARPPSPPTPNPGRCYVLNETGHEVFLVISRRTSNAIASPVEVLATKRLPASQPAPTPTPRGILYGGGGGPQPYSGPFPHAIVDPREQIDPLTQYLEVSETIYLKETQVIDLYALSKRDGGGSLKLRLTTDGMRVSFAQPNWR